MTTSIATIIDPLAVVLAHMAAAPAIRAVCGERVAAKHKYGLGLDQHHGAPDAWPIDAPALRIQPSGGVADRDTARQVLDLQVTCFGPSQAEAMRVYGALVTVARATQRTRVETATGAGLLYYVVITVPPQFGFELIGDQVGMDVVTVTAQAAVSECVLP
jgi:hypothetical protein